METDVEQRIANLEADRTALLIVLATLMQTHHNGDRMHLQLTTNLEIQISDTGSLGKLLDTAQKARVRELIEWLGGVRSSAPPSQPQPPETGR